MENGRVMVLADHSVFINDMLRGDNQNAIFAYNCFDWLTESGKRKKVLFVEEGDVITTFDVPLQDLPDWPTPPVSELVNHVLSGLEDRDDLHNLLKERRVTRDGLLKVLLIFVTLGLFLYGILRLLRARQRIEPHVPLLAPTVTQLAPKSPLVEQRHRAMLREGNLWEAARDLARQCFPAETPVAPLARPRIHVQAHWWQRRALRRQIERLWQVAHGDRPERISAYEFSCLAVQVEDLQAAHARGKWRLDDNVPSPAVGRQQA
jgi:hypothetical protein